MNMYMKLTLRLSNESIFMQLSLTSRCVGVRLIDMGLLHVIYKEWEGYVLFPRPFYVWRYNFEYLEWAAIRGASML